MQIDRETIDQLWKKAFSEAEDSFVLRYHFAKLVAEHSASVEREACAKLCDDHATKDGFEGCYANACAESIRARGNHGQT